MSTLGDIDILDEPDALADAAPECEICGEPKATLDSHGWCADCRSHNDDPSPMCNCETCPSGGPYTCIRRD